MKFPVLPAAVSAAVLALFAPTATADVRFVDAVFGDDATGIGTQAAPFATITKAVASLGPVGPHSVRVAPGLYGPTHGETFPIQLPRETELRGAGPGLTTLTGEGSGTLLRMDRDVLITDLTVKRADVGILSPVGGFSITGPQRYVRRCMIRECTVGIRMTDAIHTDYGLVVANSVITGNGVGIEAEITDNDFQSCSLLIYGCTITANDVGLNAEKVWIGWELYLTLVASILRGNGDDSIDGWAAPTVVQGCVLADGSPFAGQDGNVAVDPQLAGGALSDPHLPSTSPIVDLGGPPVSWPPSVQWVGSGGWSWEASFEGIADFDGGPRAADGAVDPGADERRVPTLYFLGEVQLGTTVQPSLQGEPGDLGLVFFGLDVAPAPIAGFIWLAPPWFPVGSTVLDAGGLGGVAVPIPGDPALTGADLYFQGIRVTPTVIDGTTPEWLRLLP